MLPSARSYIKTIPIGCLDLKKFRRKNKYNEHKNIVIGSVGGLTKQKGYRYLIEASKILSLKYPRNVRIEIVGTGPRHKALQKK